MFIKTLKVENFKCFKKQDFEFSTPSQTTSGLNIFVGENNTGKSTVFEAIDFLRNGVPYGKTINKLKNKGCKKNDEMYVEITFEGNISEIINDFSEKKYLNYVFSNKGIEFLKIRRSDRTYTIKQNGKDVQINPRKIGVWNSKNNQYENPAGFDNAFKNIFEIDFIWADTNPEDIVDFGTTKVCGKLLSKIAENFFNSTKWQQFQETHRKTFHIGTDSLKTKVEQIEKKTQAILNSQFGAAKLEFDFLLPDSQSFFKSTQIIVDDGVKTEMDQKGSGMQRAIALSLLQVYAETIVKSSNSKIVEKPFYLFIDEPEICLHPKAQFKLYKALDAICKTKQLFICTHSPYFLKESSTMTGGIFIFTNDSSLIKAERIDNKKWGNFRWSPSWGEINFYAFNLPTIEFHNELYSWLQFQSGEILINDFDQYLINEKGINKFKSYKKNSNTNPRNITISTYIRNQINHPDNRLNQKYTETEFEESIKILLGCL